MCCDCLATDGWNLGEGALNGRTDDLAKRICGAFMRSRQINFFIKEDLLPEVMESISTNVLPRFREMPHFLGLTVLKSASGPLAEIVATSYWDDGLEDSESVSAEFVDELYRVTGASPSRKVFDIVLATVRCSDGNFDQRPSGGSPY